MSRHKTSYVISYHGILCHDMSYVTTIAASLLKTDNINTVWRVTLEGANMHSIVPLLVSGCSVAIIMYLHP